MIVNQIVDAALSLEYSKQYAVAHNNLNHKQIYLLEQCVVCQHLSIHLDWQCYNPRASYDKISKAVQDEVYSCEKTFVSGKRRCYECGGYFYSGKGQGLGQFWVKLAVGNATLKKTSSNTYVTGDNGNYLISRQ